MPRLLLCLAVGCLVALAFTGARAYAEDEPEEVPWAHDYCWETGQPGAESEKCEAVWEPGYLASHTIDDDDGVQKFRQSQQGAYCSTRGVAKALQSEETRVFGTPSPSGSYQMGDGYGNVCASWWPSPSDPVLWGLQLSDTSKIEHECDGIAPSERCSIERYLVLATEAEVNARSAKDYPWASYLGHDPWISIQTSSFDEVFAFHPGGYGSGWGYRCPVLEDRKSGNIMEVCLEEWRGFGSTCVPYTWPCEQSQWRLQHVAECHSPIPGFEHSFDRVILGREETSTLDSKSGEPLEEKDYPVRTDFGSHAIESSEIEAMAELDNRPYKEAPGHYDTPEIGYGCGRESSDPSSTNPAEWALIGYGSGIEEWETEHIEEGLVKTQLAEGLLLTKFYPNPVEISNESATAGNTEAGVSAEINPYGSDTDYYVAYQSKSGKHTTPVMSAGSGVSPVPVHVTLHELSPHSEYEYRVVAYRANGAVDEYADYYGAWSSFDTQPRQCLGASIKGLGATLQTPAQALWAAAFNTSTGALACSGSQGSGGKPRVEYVTSGANAGSGACLRAFGAEGGTPRYGEYPFCGTEEPPNGREKAEIESHRDGGEAESLETIPVSQEAIAVLVHLPKGCTATSEFKVGKTEKSYERLSLDQKEISDIYAGTIKTWAQLTSSQPKADGKNKIKCTEGGSGDTIHPVVRLDRSGTTHMFKAFLEQVNTAEFPMEGFHEVADEKPCPESAQLEEGVGRTWEEVSEGCENQRWPLAAHPLRPLVPGDRGVIDEVNSTESSIGYADLAVAQELKFFNAPEGGEGKTEFWALVQNSGVTGKTETFAEPSTVAGDKEAEGNSNCEDSVYVNKPGEKFPPESTRDDWSEVKAEKVSKTYAICGITYDLALAEYQPYLAGLVSTNEGLEHTVTTQNYLTFVTVEGIDLVVEHDYARLPKNVAEEAEVGAEEIGYAKPCEIEGCEW